MTRQIATVVLDGEWLIPGAPSMIAPPATRVPGVIRADAAPVMETAYVEYGDRCSIGALLRTLAALGMRASPSPANQGSWPGHVS